MSLIPIAPIKTTGNNLVGLWRPSFVKVNETLYLYGGGGNVTNDLHVLHLGAMKWETLKDVKGTPPSKRYGHTATLWNDKYIIIFGGCDEFQQYCNDIYAFDIEEKSWAEIKTENEIQPRYLHSASIHNNQLFVYGGFAKKSDCTYVLDSLSVLDLSNSKRWIEYNNVSPRYNHSSTVVGNKMYIYAGKDENGNTVSDLFVVHLNSPPYQPHQIFVKNTNMVLLKSQHFCESVFNKLFIFGKYLVNDKSIYGLWILDLDTFEWKQHDSYFNTGGWNYFTISTANQMKHLLFLGNMDPFRPQGYDHFRDALLINTEYIGLYDISPPLTVNSELNELLDNQEMSDFTIIPSNGKPLHVHQIILFMRWPHFRNMYKSGMIECNQKKLFIPESYKLMSAFIKYLYSDTIDHTDFELICDLLVLANMYLLTRLKKICCYLLYQHHLTIATCGVIFGRAIMSEETGLKLLTLDYMFKHYGLILKSDILSTMNTAIRQEFLTYIPEEAILTTKVAIDTTIPTHYHHIPHYTHLQQQQHEQQKFTSLIN